VNNIVVLGSGIAGLGATHRLQKDGIKPVVFEKNAYHGGQTASFWNDAGFLFDLGPHISFTKDERIQDILANYVNHEYESLQVKLRNYWNGIWLTHPVQLHMHGLPHDLIVEMVSEFVKEQHGPERKINNYEDWLVASYGRKFAELFPMQYTRKYHTTEANNMCTEWLGPRMYRPSLEEMLKGALAPWNPKVHYVSHFRYPTRNGFVSYLKEFPKMADIKLNHEVATIDPRKKEIRFTHGVTSAYDKIVSAIPLPELIPMIQSVPRDVIEAAQQLACSTCVLVNVGVNRADLSESHMTYFYDQDICFTRLSFPHMLSPNNAPPDHGSVQAEVYFSKKYRPLTQSPESLLERVIKDLTRSGVLREDDKILSRDARLLRYANVIFDLDRAKALETVHGFLNDVGIAYCGRYGDWGYMWTDESFISGERAAEKALSEK
jgi:protoporphyrinogen oxidase